MRDGIRDVRNLLDFEDHEILCVAHHVVHDLPCDIIVVRKDGNEALAIDVFIVRRERKRDLVDGGH